MAKTDTKADKPAEAAKPKRKQRSYEERIAELQAKAEAQANRRRKTATKQLKEAAEQRKVAAERLERIDARIAELKAVLGDTDEEASGEPAADEAGAQS